MSGLFSKILLGTMSAGLLLGAALPAAANPPPTLQYRINHEQARIDQGLRSGQITQAEYDRDQRNLNLIRAGRNSDGSRLTNGQQANLRNWLNIESNRIYTTKHNVHVQPGTRM